MVASDPLVPRPGHEYVFQVHVRPRAPEQPNMRCALGDAWMDRTMTQLPTGRGTRSNNQREGGEMEMQDERRVLGRFPGKRRQPPGWNRKGARGRSPEAAIGIGQRERPGA